MTSKTEELIREGMKHEGFREGYAARGAMIRLGDMLRQTRESAGYTQEYLAKKIGMSQPAISRLESGFGPHGPEMDTVTRFVHGCEAELVVGIKANAKNLRARETSQIGESALAFATLL
ncbi:MAG: helix-turn-helix transcriptional regulator [Pseudomonadota bacterium]|nr:helix-turn-helix transcriptional regulator [Pseudomonadota bacterium]